MVDPRQLTARAGVTMFELMAASTMSVILMIGTSRLLSTTDDLYATVYLEMETDRASRKAAQQVRSILQDARLSTFTPALPAVAPGNPIPFVNDFTFRAIEGWQSGGVVMGPVQRLFTRLEPTETVNGVDDDGDGLVDELQLVHTPNTGASPALELVIAGGIERLHPGEFMDGVDDNANGLVDEPGFCVWEDRGFLRVQIAMSKERSSGARSERNLIFDVRTQP